MMTPMPPRKPSQSRRNLLVSLTLLLAAMTLHTPAQAELIDLSAKDNTTESGSEIDLESGLENGLETFSSRDAYWIKKPNMSRVARYRPSNAFGCVYDAEQGYTETCKTDKFSMLFKLRVDKEGSIVKIEVVESSGIAQVDKAFMQAIKPARLKPFMKQGQPVMGIVLLPVVYAKP